MLCCLPKNKTKDYGLLCVPEPCNRDMYLVLMLNGFRLLTSYSYQIKSNWTGFYHEYIHLAIEFYKVNGFDNFFFLSETNPNGGVDENWGLVFLFSTAPRRLGRGFRGDRITINSDHQSGNVYSGVYMARSPNLPIPFVAQSRRISYSVSGLLPNTVLMRNYYDSCWERDDTVISLWFGKAYEAFDMVGRWGSYTGRKRWARRRDVVGLHQRRKGRFPY